MRHRSMGKGLNKVACPLYLAGYKIISAIARQTSLRLRLADDMLARFPGLTNEFTIA